ncbi:MAG: arginine--tRNA ligase [Halobacteriaceae archaeon]
MFLSFRAEVEAAVADALRALDLPTDDLGVEEPPADVDAVLASSVAFRLADTVGAPPPAIAEDIATAIDPSTSTYIETVTAQGPYVNFMPGPQYYDDTLTTVDEDWGRHPDTEESIVVEHTSVNPTGPLHVGRARNTIIGDALARILTFAGHDVDRHYYVNDAGRQMAVFTWAYETFDEDDLPAPDRDKPDYDLVRYYRRGHEYLETADPQDVDQAEATIAEIIQGIEAGDEATLDRVWTVVDQVLEGTRQTLARLPAPFDEFVRETRFIRDGSKDAIVDRLQASDAAQQDEGAWVLDLEDGGIEKEFVFLRSDGTSLYTTRDLAHHEWKFGNYDRAITVLGEDQKLHADQLRAALELLGNDTDQLSTVFYSWVDLPEGGMSTRKGTGIDIDDLLDEAVRRARAEVEARLDDRTRGDLTDDDIDRIARQVGIGAVRFDIVAKQPTKGITFDWEEALDFEAQSAPYVQYAHARSCGILDGIEETGDPDALALTHPASRTLLDAIARFPAVVETAAADHEPHRVAAYAREFADHFNTFYRECPVQSAEGDVRDTRVAVVRAARHTLANALWLLGIAAPESM